MQSYQIVDWGKPLQLRIRETPVPQGEEVLVRIEASGVCHSDVHIRAGYFDLGGGRQARLSDAGAPLPLTMGHEIAGTVVAMGPQASGVTLGTRGVVYPWIGCGHCGFCAQGRDVDCEAPRSLGTRRDGGYSDHVIVPKGRYIVPVGKVDIHLAATYACSSLTAFGALQKLPPLGGDDRVLLIGAGGLGLAACAIAPLVTEARLVVADIDPAKLGAATRQGAWATFDARDPGGALALKQAAGGPIRGVIDFVGSRDSAQLAMGVATKGTVIIIVGLHGGSLEVPLPLLPTRNLTIRGSYVGRLEDLQALIRFAEEGRLPPIPVTQRPLAEVDRILDELDERRLVGRVVVTP
jgi:D-arabinose 1-dehydrogenase-like Zn-dependent alcohol dehydrogenase